mgnify:CR=1 FL=1
MEKKNEMTEMEEIPWEEMEIGDEDWFACWNYHQHLDYFPLGLQQRIFTKMKENKEHYSNEQMLAVSTRLLMDKIKHDRQADEILQKEYETLKEEKEELEEKYNGIENELNEAITKINEQREEYVELQEEYEELENANIELAGDIDSAREKIKELLECLC